MTGLSLFFSDLSQSRRLPLLQVVSNNKSFSVGVQSPTEINAPRGCAVILRRICQLTLTRITHQVSRAFDLKFLAKLYSFPVIDQMKIHGILGTKRIVGCDSISNFAVRFYGFLVQTTTGCFYK